MKFVRWTLCYANGLRLFVLSCGHSVWAPDRPPDPKRPDEVPCRTCEFEQ